MLTCCVPVVGPQVDGGIVNVGAGALWHKVLHQKHESFVIGPYKWEDCAASVLSADVLISGCALLIQVSTVDTTS